MCGFGGFGDAGPGRVVLSVTGSGLKTKRRNFTLQPAKAAACPYSGVLNELLKSLAGREPVEPPPH